MDAVLTIWHALTFA